MLYVYCALVKAIVREVTIINRHGIGILIFNNIYI